MKIILLLILFALVTFLAAKQKKWYICLLAAFAELIPEQFAFELHDKLPLISGIRVLVLVVLAFWLYDKWKTKKFSLPKSILIYIGVNLLISLVNLRWGGGEIKRIFLFIFERGLLVIALADMIKTREEFESTIDFMLLGSVILALIAMAQTVFKYDILSVLHVTDRFSVQLTDRMGLIRAFGATNAIAYGCYCAFISLLAVYKLRTSGKQYYGIALALNFVAMLCTMSRSAWLCFAFISFCILVFQGKYLFKKLLPSFGIAVSFILVLCLCQPILGRALTETAKSTANTVLSAVLPEGTFRFEESSESLFPPEEDENAPDIGFDISDEFGLNKTGASYSRLVEWTSVSYMLEEGEGIFGYGYNAFLRGKLHYFYKQFGFWTVAKTLDVGLLNVATESGILGLCTFLAFLGYLFYRAFQGRGKQETFNFLNIVLYMIPLYLLINFMAAYLYATTVWLFIGLFYAYRKLDTHKLLSDAPAVTAPAPTQSADTDC